MLSTVQGISRSNLKAVEWALNEVTDNVLNHSDSIDGGFVQLSYKRNSARQSVEIVVCDSGIGIPKSLRGTFPEIKDDAEALEKSVQEGVTRNTVTNQGNGLYGSFEISRVSKGKFSLIAGECNP
jgi:anti-sigma regulatory factor (Ser/Thr protein kinase)